MTDDLDAVLREARPAWPDPSREVTASARAGSGLVPRRTARRGRRRWLAGVALVAAGGAAATAAILGGGGAPEGPSAVLPLGAPERVGGPVDGADGHPVLGVDGDGGITLVWGHGGNIMARERGPDGEWAPAVPLSRPGRRAADPAVAVAPDGRAVVVWRELSEARDVEERLTLPGGAPAGEMRAVVDRGWSAVARLRPRAGMAWAAPQPLSAVVTSARDIVAPQAAVDRRGRLTVAWDQGATVRLVHSDPADDPGWSEAATLTGDGPGEVQRLALAVAPDGHVLVAWVSRGGAGRPDAVSAALAEPSGRFGAVSPLVQVPPANARIAADVGDGGDAAVAVVAAPEDIDDPDSALVILSDERGWGAPERATDAGAGFHLGTPTVLRAAGGRTVLHVTGGRPALVERSAAEGTWRASERPATGRTASVRIVRDPAGDTLVAAYEPGSATRIGLLGTPGQVIPASGVAALAVGPRGRVAAAWLAQGSLVVATSVREP